MRVAFLYPGQGTQYPGMLAELPASPASGEVITRIAGLAGVSSAELDSAGWLASTIGDQISLYAAGVAASRALAAHGAEPDAVAGHSVGAFAAAVAAGALTIEEGFRAVRLRARLMRERFPAGYGMLALIGLTVPQVTRLIAATAADDDPAYLAVINAPAYTVCAGSDAALGRLSGAAARAGARAARRLAMTVPSHCPLLQPVSLALSRELAHIPRRALTCPCVASTTGALLTTQQAVLEDLASGVAATVQWDGGTGMLAENGVRLFVQVPPGDLLVRLLRRGYPEARTVSVGVDGLANAAALARLIKSG